MKRNIMRPDFDPHEEYLVAYYRQYQQSSYSRSIVPDLATVAIGVAFFGLGYFKGDVTWSMVGFGLVAYRALKGVISGARYNRILVSIIDKYEHALTAESAETKTE